MLKNSWLLLGALAAACGGGNGAPAGKPDAPNAIDAPPPLPDATVVTSAFTIHYHRAAGDYAGWSPQITAGATAAGATAGTADGFGAVYNLTLAEGATGLSFSLVNGASTDAAGPLTVDVTGTREVWVISGWPDAIRRRLPAFRPTPRCSTTTSTSSWSTMCFAG